MRRLVVLASLGFVIGFSCKSVDPSKGIFSCETATDCGAGYECRPQFAGGGRCFPDGACSNEESCNGTDDTCDGRIDETFSTMGEACSSGRPGVCSAGKKVCTLGAIACEGTVMPSAELCNQLDDDCNGTADETFDLTTDSANCGMCGRQCGVGTRCLRSVCIENRCEDGLDNDSNGKTDCEDEVCFGFECNTMVQPSSRCGFAPIVPDAGSDGGASQDGGTDGGPPNDAGTPDAGAPDGGTSDAGPDDAGALDAGFVRGCFRPESQCDDGFDNDGDGFADCVDPDCDGRTCYSGLTCSGRVCPGPG